MKRKIKNLLYVFLALLSVATAVTLPVLAAALYPVEDGSNMAFAMKVILSDLRRIQIEDEVLLKSVFESFLTFGHAHISLAAL
ncbi:MAG: hypothetical protein J6U17_04400 [Kiritimatiellae bacterium]|nr:hypothetical protein [Kiritimatiellia bacterium]